MSTPPMLRKGYYVASVDNNTWAYHTVKVSVNENGDMAILKAPTAVSLVEGFVVVDAKTVYRVSLNDFFSRHVPAAAKLSDAERDSRFVKYRRPTVVSFSPAVLGGSDGVSAENQDDLEQANRLLENHLQAVL